MQMKDTLIVSLCALVGLGLLVGASLRLPSLHDAREEMGLVVNPSLENAPPSLAFATTAMGAFRGLIVDILWMRADRLKENGQFFDAKQLAEWITVLQPRFAAVWDFHAWNMAYNISVAVPSEQWAERWRWVRNGYELLRDRAIPINPQSIILYRQLAWIFQHKIAGVTDDCHRHYKRELALEMRQLLGYPETYAEFEALIAAPRAMQEILADPEVAKFVDGLRETHPDFRGSDTEFIQHYLALRQNPKQYPEEAFAVVDAYRGSPALTSFDVFARAYQLRNKWKMDPAFMNELNRKYGRVSIDDPNDRMPLNWEHPNAHAIYWAELGLKVAGRPEHYSIDEKNTDRIVFHGLQDMYRRGDIIMYDVPDEPASVFLRPDLSMFDSCNEVWKDAIRKYESLEDGNPKAVMGGHRNFLENAVELFYRAGHKRKAAEVFLQLRRDYSTGPHSGDYSMTMPQFVIARIREELPSISDKDAAEQIVMSLHEAYFRYAVHQDNEAAAREAWAREIYDIYQRETGSAEQYRMGLPPFENLRYIAFIGFLSDAFYPDYMRRNLLARIENERPDLYENLVEQEEIIKQFIQQQSGEGGQGGPPTGSTPISPG